MTVAPQLFLEDFHAGQIFEGEARLISEADVLTFSGLTGDKHPIHYDPVYAEKTRFGRPIVHGLHLISLTALGATPLSNQLEDSMIAFVEERATFLKPVFVGDRVRPSFAVVGVDGPKQGRDWGQLKLLAKLCNGPGEIVLECAHIYRLRCRPNASFQA
jgi:3-hydroxybutyryl-CoA dehydratase